MEQENARQEIDKGAYQIRISIRTNIVVSIGALGEVNFTKGEYVYTGSAMKNLKKRVERHRKKIKKLHWHIDYLLNHYDVSIIEINIFESDRKIECELNRMLLENVGVSVPIKGFGSSDCKICPTHLLKLP